MPRPGAPETDLNQFNAAALAIAQPSISAIVELNSKFYENAARLGTELSDFVTKRLQEDLTTSQRLITCRSPQEFQQIYADWWSKAFGQYQNELGRVAKLSETMIGDTVSVVQEYTESVTREARRAA